MLPRRHKIALLLAASTFCLILVVGCEVRRPGTVVNMGNSYGREHQAPLTAQFGCGDAVALHSYGRPIDDNPPGFVAQKATMLDLLPSWIPRISEMTGPVTIVLHAGNGEEVLGNQTGLTPEKVAANATTLIEGLLSIRPDLTIHLMTGAGRCRATFQTLLEIADPRFEVPDISALDPAFEPGETNPYMDDDCHPSSLGAVKRVEELLRVSPLAAAGKCL